MRRDSPYPPAFKDFDYGDLDPRDIKPDDVVQIAADGVIVFEGTVKANNYPHWLQFEELLPASLRAGMMLRRKPIAKEIS